MESGGLFVSQASAPLAPLAPSVAEWQEPIQERAPIPVRQEQLLDHFHHDMMDDEFANSLNGNSFK